MELPEELRTDMIVNESCDGWNLVIVSLKRFISYIIQFTRNGKILVFGRKAAT